MLLKFLMFQNFLLKLFDCSNFNNLRFLISGIPAFRHFDSGTLALGYRGTFSLCLQIRMKTVDKNTAISLMNRFGAGKVPFLFVLDYEMEQCIVLPVSELDDGEIRFEIFGNGNFPQKKTYGQDLNFKSEPIAFEEYEQKFMKLAAHIHWGDTYLANLTIKTPVTFNASLEEIAVESNAPYKLWIKDKIAVFSPESFVKISDGKISSFPMKGTIDAALADAENKLLSNEKELAEHYTIVDLIRNDMSIAAHDVQVERFRYVEKLRTHRSQLLQTSSEISGKLPHDFQKEIGTLMAKLLPAGSISGAPKKKTVEILNDIEASPRGFYTGVFGIFDGQNLESAVMIRFIEQQGGKMYFRSGGGITSMSLAKEEYNEVLQKIYVPVY